MDSEDVAKGIPERKVREYIKQVFKPIDDEFDKILFLQRKASASRPIMFNGFRFVDKLEHGEVVMKRKKRNIPIQKWEAAEWNLTHPEGKMLLVRFLIAS